MAYTVSIVIQQDGETTTTRKLAELQSMDNADLYARQVKTMAKGRIPLTWPEDQ